MKDMGSSHDFGGFQNGPGEQSETFGVIGIITSGRTVEGIAVEIRRVFHKIEADATLNASGNYRRKAVLIVKRHGDAADDGGRIGKLGLAIAREVYADLMAEGGQRVRKSADHIGQTAGL